MPTSGLHAHVRKKSFASTLQLEDNEVEAEAYARGVLLQPGDDARALLEAAVTAELQQMYGNVNTLLIHADKQVYS